MSDVVVNLKPNGPLFVAGPARIVDSTGKAFNVPPGKPGVALCRCGQSKNRPFCDGSHKAAGFQDDTRAPA